MGSLTMEEFLGHSTRGSRGQVLKGWTKKGKILVWLNVKSRIHCAWRHPFRKVVALKDKPPDIWSEKFLCFEQDEEVLRNQNRRDSDGNRTHPATACGFCRFLDDLYKSIKAGDVDWCSSVFAFDAGGKKEVLHAGGLIGFFKSDKLTDEDKAAMASVGVYQKTAWKEDVRAKAEYVFCVVDADDPRSGVQMSIEPGGLGDKMKRAIGDQLKARREKGDPYANPYPFLWEYNEGAASFNDMYSVVPMIEERPSAEVLRLINAPGPDTSSVTRASESGLVRAMLESADVMGIDWAGYFPEGEPAPVEKVPEVSTTDDLVGCDGCGKAMPASASKCGSCGKTYDVEPASPQKAAPSPPPSPPKQPTKDVPLPPPPKDATATPLLPKGVPSGIFAGSEEDIPF